MCGREINHERNKPWHYTFMALCVGGVPQNKPMRKFRNQRAKETGQNRFSWCFLPHSLHFFSCKDAMIRKI